MASSFKPFDKVTYDIEKDGITYTYGGTVICTYSDDSTDMVGVSLLNNNGVVYVEEDDVTAV